MHWTPIDPHGNDISYEEWERYSAEVEPITIDGHNGEQFVIRYIGIKFFSVLPPAPWAIEWIGCPECRPNIVANAVDLDHALTWVYQSISERS